MPKSTALVADERLAGAEVVEHELTWPDLAARVAGADLVIAMRYHAVAAAAQAGRPTIALAYEPKVRSLAADLGLPSLDVDDPLLRSRLGELVARELADPGTSVADAAAIAALRDRAWLAIHQALGPAPEGQGRTTAG